MKDEKIMLKNILKKLLLYLSPLILMSVVVFCLYLPSTGQYVMGAAGNENGDFVVAMDLEDTNKGFRVYNNEGRLINSFKIQWRGHFNMAVVDEYIILRDTGDGRVRYYDLKGNKLSDIPDLNGEDLITDYSYTLRKNQTWDYDGYSIAYEQDKRGDEHIYLIRDGKTVNVDIDYGYCKNRKHWFQFAMLCILPSLTAFLILSILGKTAAINEKLNEFSEFINEKFLSKFEE